MDRVQDFAPKEDNNILHHPPSKKLWLALQAQVFTAHFKSTYELFVW
jgi:hypothetical protein